MKSRLLFILVLFGCMVGYTGNVMAENQPPLTLLEQIKNTKLKKSPPPTTTPAAGPKASVAPTPAGSHKSPAPKVSSIPKPAGRPTTPKATPVLPAPKAPAVAESVAEKIIIPDPKTAAALYAILNDKIIGYHNKKRTNKIADDPLANDINKYFLDHQNEITQNSLTTEVLRIFVKDLFLSISTQAYEIAKNIINLNSDQREAVKKEITQAQGIAKKNIEHLPSIDILIKLSEALPEKDKDTALNLPTEVLTLLGKSNKKIVDEEMKALTKSLYKAATGKPFPESEPKPGPKGKPATPKQATEQPSKESSDIPPPPPPMPQEGTKGEAPLLPLVLQISGVKATAATTPRPPTPADLKTGQAALKKTLPKAIEELKLKKAVTIVGQTAQRVQLKNLKKRKEEGPISPDDLSTLQQLEALYPEASAPKPQSKQLPPPQEDTRDTVLAQIREGVQLKKAMPLVIPRETQPDKLRAEKEALLLEQKTLQAEEPTLREQEKTQKIKKRLEYITQRLKYITNRLKQIEDESKDITGMATRKDQQKPDEPEPSGSEDDDWETK